MMLRVDKIYPAECMDLVEEAKATLEEYEDKYRARLESRYGHHSSLRTATYLAADDGRKEILAHIDQIYSMYLPTLVIVEGKL